MPKRMGILMMTLLLVLPGCRRQSSAETAGLELRGRYQQLEHFYGEALITADYGQRGYQYQVTCEGNAAHGQLTVTAPESIAGTGTGWVDGTTNLTYEGIYLDTGPVSPDGLSPADCMPVLLDACCRGSILESGWYDAGEEQQLYLLLENPRAQYGTIALWADPESQAMERAELRWKDTVVVTVDFQFMELDQADSESR